MKKRNIETAVTTGATVTAVSVERAERADKGKRACASLYLVH